MSDSLTPYDDLVAVYEAAVKAGDFDQAKKAARLLLLQADVKTVSPPKPVDPLDVEYDGVLLRQLIEWDAAAGREEFVLDPDSSSRSIAAVVVRAAFSSAQRAAVSAHWSAELSKRTDAAKQKDRNQVTMEQDDE